MSLSWPWALLAAAAFPLLLGFRWWMRRHRRRGALRMPSVALIRAALPGRSPWRRRIPLWLLAAALLVLSVGAARPRATVIIPTDSSSILLAIDASGSMCSSDVAPNRLTAAENAAKDFVKAQRNGTKIGLVVFSGLAALRVPPTTDKNALVSAIGGLQTGRGTAIGIGILTSLDAIAQINPDVPPTGASVSPSATDGFEPDTIVVLTDGANTQGVEPVTAAQQAADRHVRIYTIGFGTTNPAASVCTADQLGAGTFGGGQGGRGFGGGPGGFGGGAGGFGGGTTNGRRVFDLDEDTLTKVASLTGGKYFRAQDAKQLSDVLLNLPNAIVLQHRHAEITYWFALVGALLALAAVGLSQWWNRSAPLVRQAPAPANSIA